MVKKILSRKKVNPSTPVFTGEKQVEKISVQLFKYNEAYCEEDSSYPAESFKGFPSDDYHYWLNTHGIHDSKLINEVCKAQGIHSLVIQDILDVNQRAKYQDFGNYWFFTTKSILPSNERELQEEQISFVLGKNYLMSFQEKKADYFDHVRERLRQNIGIVRKKSSDYLLFLALESILDNYSNTVFSIEGKIEKIRIINAEIDPSPEILMLLEDYKRQLLQVKNTIIPIKDFIVRIEREKFNFIKDENIKYYYELRDICLSLLDDCEHLDLKLESNTNLFFSVQGHNTNQVMKTLTIVATIFIPLTFIAGVYGMNFNNMPELGWKYGYLFIWVIMIIILVMMIFYFRRKKWL